MDLQQFPHDSQKSEFAQAYTERMFPDIAAPAGYIDPEFEVLFDNFAFDEVINEEGRNVPAKDRFLAILATLVGYPDLPNGLNRREIEAKGYPVTYID